MLYITARTYKNLENANQYIASVQCANEFIIRKRMLKSGKVKVYVYDPDNTKLKRFVCPTCGQVMKSVPAPRL